MLDPIFALVAMMMVLSYPTGGEPLFFLEPGRRAVDVAGVEIPTAFLFTALIVLLYGLWSAALFSFGLERPEPDALRRLSRRRWLNRVLSLLLFGPLIYLFHLPLHLQIGSSITLTAALSMAPYFMMSGFSALFSSLREVLIKRAETLPSILWFGFRAAVGFAVLPIFSLLVLLDAARQVPGLERFVAVHPVSLYFLTFGAMGLLLGGTPFLLRFVFGAYPLPDRGLREELLALGARARFSCADLLVLPTSGMKVGNAFIVGLFGPLRYVFFTDYLLRSMTREQIACVLAHEIGHAKRHHLTSFFFFSVTSVVFAAVFHDYLSMEKSPAAPLVFPAFVVVWISLLGFMSRRFESEADLYGARLYGDYDAFSGALLTVALINGMPPGVGGFRHFSIERRVRMVQDAKRQPLYGEIVELIARTIRRFCFWFFVSAVSILITEAYRQTLQTPERERWYQASLQVEEARLLLFDQAEYARAESELIRAVEANPSDPRAQLYLSYARLGLGHFPDALRSLERAEELGLIDPIERLLARHIRRTLPP
jgi:Zn-dependent protease with chaperone function